jgi:hypothetical protein
MKERLTLETARLLLRPFTVADAPDVQRLAGEREIASTTLHVPHPYEDGMAEQGRSCRTPRSVRGLLGNRPPYRDPSLSHSGCYANTSYLSPRIGR